MNKALNGWKFIFAILIVCHHSLYVLNDVHFCRCYLAVEFFFIVSGFFIAKSWNEKRKESPFLWWKRKSLRIYPVFIYSIMLLVLIGLLAAKNSKVFIVSNKDLIYELLFLNNAGITKYAINIPDWYVSCMLISGFFYMAFMTMNENLLKFLIIPTAIIFGISFLVNNFQTLNVHSKIIFSIIDIGVIRAFVDMGVGIELYYYVSSMHKGNNKIYNSLLEVLLCLAIYLFLINSNSSRYDILIIPIFSLLIVACFLNRGIIAALLESNVVQFLGKFSLPLYLTHFVVIRYIQYTGTPVTIFEFVFASIVFAMVSYYIIRFVTSEKDTSIFRRPLKLGVTK